MGYWVWKVDSLPRIKAFMWQCLHNSIGMGECLVKRHLSESDRCPLCQGEVETILHRLRDCEIAKATGNRLGVLSTINFFEGNLHIWLEKNCKDNTCRVNNQPPWRIIFPFVIWLMWKQRNNALFRGQHIRYDVHSEAIFLALEFLHCALNPSLSGSRKLIQIRWEKPSPGWIRLNTDGPALGNPGLVGCDGIIRNEHGDWLGGFSRSIGVTTSFIVEL